MITKGDHLPYVRIAGDFTRKYWRGTLLGVNA